MANSGLRRRWATVDDQAQIERLMGVQLKAKPLREWLEAPAIALIEGPQDQLCAVLTLDVDQATLGPSWRLSASPVPDAELKAAINRARHHLLSVYGLMDDESDPVQRWLTALGIASSYGPAHRLRRVPDAETLSDIGSDCFDRPQRLLPAAAEAWQAMRAAAADAAVTLQVVSAYRSVDYQAQLIERKLAAGQALDEILKVSAAPGYSEHHSGRAVDITCPGVEVLSEAFAQSAAYQWLMQHAAQYHFICSFPANNRHGLIWEPWHWCYRPDEIWR